MTFSAMNNRSAILKCGIYRTTIPLPGKEDWVRENLLVYFHNHSQQGPPLVLLPDSNIKNRWTFFDKGYLVRSAEFLNGLMPLLPEGLYILMEPMYLSATEVVPEKSLVQLGYNRAAEPILFAAEFDANTIFFPTRGTKVTTESFSVLAPVPFLVPNFHDPH